MPTILRFRNMNVGIFVADHRPAHVHVVGGGIEVVFQLNCWMGPVRLRDRMGSTVQEERAIMDFLGDHLDELCRAWEAIHGDPI